MAVNKNILFAVLAGAAVAGLLSSLAAYGGTAQASQDIGVHDNDIGILDLDECYPKYDERYPDLDKDYPGLDNCYSDLRKSTGVISVSGSAGASVDPDLLTVTLGVDIVKPTAAEALAENSRVLTGVVDAITSAGVTEGEISTSYLNIYPDYEGVWDEFGNYQRMLVGYRASNTITITTSNLTIAADILDGAVGAGANTVESVRFALSPQVEKSIREDLIAEAVSNALNKAEIALDPLDHEIVGIQSVLVDVDEAIAPVSRILEDTFAFAADEGSTPIFSSDQTLRTFVTVTFYIGPE